jgi:shikimate dehydrogenase
MINARTRLFALLGDPVAHSLSPVMQNAGFRAAGLDARYLALRCSGDDLLGVMRTLVHDGGGGNVTVPHKLLAGGAGIGDARVRALGAANVFSSHRGELRVSNTDVDGLLALIDRIGAPAAAWCVVGTGGSARAVAGAAAERGARLAVVSRDPVRGMRFSEWAAGLNVAPAALTECQVLINATPLGLHETDPLPMELGGLPVISYVIDLTYRPHRPTALVSAALERGLAAVDGREMLLIQGVAAWAHWFPGVSVPVEVMRAALEGRMG